MPNSFQGRGNIFEGEIFERIRYRISLRLADIDPFFRLIPALHAQPGTLEAAPPAADPMKRADLCGVHCGIGQQCFPSERAPGQAKRRLRSVRFKPKFLYPSGTSNYWHICKAELRRTPAHSVVGQVVEKSRLSLKNLPQYRRCVHPGARSGEKHH